MKAVQLIGLGIALLLTNAAFAATPEDYAVDSTLTVPLFHSQAVQLERPAARVSVGNPDIADILILRASQLYVIGKDLGTTNVLLWDKNDILIGKFDVQITHNLEDLKRKLYLLMPDENIEVFSAERAIVLRGTVSSIGAMDAALRIAKGYVSELQVSKETTEFEQDDEGEKDDDDKVINLMQVGGGQQVMLQVKVAEIARTEMKRLNAQFNALSVKSSRWSVGGLNGGGSFPDAEAGAMKGPV